MQEKKITASDLTMAATLSRTDSQPSQSIKFELTDPPISIFIYKDLTAIINAKDVEIDNLKGESV